MTAKAPAIGIDLGTSYSCVGVYHQGKVEIIPNDLDKRTTPSVVYFSDTGRIIGESTTVNNPTNTIYNIKRLIGRPFNDPSIQTDMKNLPFEVINNRNKSQIRVDYKGDQRSFYPEEISAMTLIKMKETAEAFLGTTVTEAVVSVPACFNDTQRWAVKDAGTIAGLRILQLINEPSAACMAYLHQKKDFRNGTILIVDLGGGNLQVSIVAVVEGIPSVKSNMGDSHLGGEDFTENMVDHFVTELQREHAEKDLLSSKSTLISSLRSACESAKIRLSTSEKACVDIELHSEGVLIKKVITRTRFEDLNDHLFKTIIRLVGKSIEDAGLGDKSTIDDVVVIGGSCHIPKIQKMLQEFFSDDGKSRFNSTSIHPDEAIAYGAALKAAILQRVDDSIMMKELALFQEITQFSFQTGSSTSRLAVPLIKRHSSIPASAKKTFLTTEDDQETVEVQIYEGDDLFVADNKLLFTIRTEGLTPAPKGETEIEIQFQVNQDGNLLVPMGTLEGVPKLTVLRNERRFTKGELTQLVATADRMRLEDIQQRRIVEKKNDLVAYLTAGNSTLLRIVQQKASTVKKINANRKLLDHLNSEEELDQKKEEMKQFFASKGILVPDDYLGNEDHQQQVKEDPADVELPSGSKRPRISSRIKQKQ